MAEKSTHDVHDILMTPRAIAYDVMRLFIGPSFLTPRGIDKVDIALARHIFEQEDCKNVGILPTPVGVYFFSAAQVLRLLDYIEYLWSEDACSTTDAQLRLLLDRILGRRDCALPVVSVSSLKFSDKVWRMLRMLSATGLIPHRLAARAVPANAIYLNVGQLGLAMPRFFNWLEKRPDITRAMMLHDAIPIDYPHLVGKTAPMHHMQMIRTAAERADCMIFNSKYTRDSVGIVVRNLRGARPPALVRPLPLSAAFVNAKTGVPELAGTRYLVAVSTIEPRKNFALLLRVWQSLVATMGEATPHLIIVGSSGKDADRILAPLQSDPAIASRICHAVGLSSPALASLVLGAAGMLCPSFAEGFGLPLIEAEALGVPTIASDIPAHREVATPTTTLLPVDDDDGWARAITALPDVSSRRCPDIPFAMTEAAYCSDILNFIRSIRPRRFDGPTSFHGRGDADDGERHL